MNRTTRLSGLTGTLLAGTLALAGCSGDPGHEGMSQGSSTSASASASGDAAARYDDDPDVAFAQGMLPHHQQAVEMAQLAADRAADSRVEDLAARIEAAQAPEIQTLSGWLEAWGAEATGSTGTDHGSTDHGDMGGTMSDEDMDALTNASGAEFDRMFLEMMTAHHSGAVRMAETEIADGEDPDAIAMAEDIRDTQNAEIAEMQELLAEFGG
ncbi:Uncharacterized conserved protein, DUF305 family [Geodermatophilus siccatus]|uniref:Uncharacterized conserved protein, DUF305 family n=1 Tax=Geodermatophilus siccatus TaxID=1137991 RepID=A0A1G9QDE2_9ACTN|nr:DUF305 domain-containing protein [Geodermatophilus siccatus]SDM08507.1 Uncharacterized conserved protein, DUF305 family [Geodermatophilus siccatus]